MSRFSQCISGLLHMGIPVSVSCCLVAVVFCYICVTNFCTVFHYAPAAGIFDQLVISQTSCIAACFMHSQVPVCLLCPMNIDIIMQMGQPQPGMVGSPGSTHFAIIMQLGHMQHSQVWLVHETTPTLL